MNADRSMLAPVKGGCRLRPGQLRRRYLRRHEREGAALLAKVRGGALDDHDDTFNDDWCCYFAFADKIAIAGPRGPLDELARLIARKRFRARLVGQREAALLCHLPLVAPAAPSLVRARGGRTVEDALAEHLDLLQDLPLPRDLPDEPRLCAGLAALGVLPLTAPLGELLKAYPKALVLLLLFAPLWRRPLQEFCPPAEVRGAALLDALVEHLLIVYPVPPFLLRTLHGPRTPALKWLCWIVLLGQGGSLVRAAPRGGWRVSARVQYYLRQAPPELEAEEACLWAQVRALGGSLQVMAWVSSHPGLRLDPTEGPKPLVLGWAAPLGGQGVTEPCSQCMWPSDDRNEERDLRRDDHEGQRQRGPRDDDGRCHRDCRRGWAGRQSRVRCGCEGPRRTAWSRWPSTVRWSAGQ